MRNQHVAAMVTPLPGLTASVSALGTVTDKVSGGTSTTLGSLRHPMTRVQDQSWVQPRVVHIPLLSPILWFGPALKTNQHKPLICYKGCKHTGDTQFSKPQYIIDFHNGSSTIGPRSFAGKCIPVHPFAMSDAPCWRNECKFTKGKKERNASYLQKYLFVTNKTYRFVFSVPKSIQKIIDIYIYIFPCETGVQVYKYPFAIIGLRS